MDLLNKGNYLQGDQAAEDGHNFYLHLRYSEQLQFKTNG